MSRERPMRLPRTASEMQGFVRRAQIMQKNELERFRAQGFAEYFLQAFAARFGFSLPKGTSKRGAGEILGELRGFYSRRPRPWRPARSAPKQPFLERLKLQRRALA